MLILKFFSIVFSFYLRNSNDNILNLLKNLSASVLGYHAGLVAMQLGQFSCSVSCSMHPQVHGEQCLMTLAGSLINHTTHLNQERIMGATVRKVGAGIAHAFNRFAHDVILKLKRGAYVAYVITHR